MAFKTCNKRNPWIISHAKPVNIKHSKDRVRVEPWYSWRMPWEVLMSFIFVLWEFQSVFFGSIIQEVLFQCLNRVQYRTVYKILNCFIFSFFLMWNTSHYQPQKKYNNKKGNEINLIITFSPDFLFTILVTVQIPSKSPCSSSLVILKLRCIRRSKPTSNWPQPAAKQCSWGRMKLCVEQFILFLKNVLKRSQTLPEPTSVSTLSAKGGHIAGLRSYPGTDLYDFCIGHPLMPYREGAQQEHSTSQQPLTHCQYT